MEAILSAVRARKIRLPTPQRRERIEKTSAKMFKPHAASAFDSENEPANQFDFPELAGKVQFASIIFESSSAEICCEEYSIREYDSPCSSKRRSQTLF